MAAGAHTARWPALLSVRAQPQAGRSHLSTCGRTHSPGRHSRAARLIHLALHTWTLVAPVSKSAPSDAFPAPTQSPFPFATGHQPEHLRNRPPAHIPAHSQAHYASGRSISGRLALKKSQPARDRERQSLESLHHCSTPALQLVPRRRLRAAPPVPIPIAWRRMICWAADERRTPRAAQIGPKGGPSRRDDGRRAKNCSTAAHSPPRWAPGSAGSARGSPPVAPTRFRPLASVGPLSWLLAHSPRRAAHRWRPLVRADAL